MEFNKVTEKRASIRRYTERKVDFEKVVEIIETANLAPSPGNLKITRFIIVENPENIEYLAKACRQEFVSQASVIVVVCSEPKKVNLLYGNRADRYTRQHAGAVIQNFLLKVTEMGLASCWVGAFSDETVRNLLKIPDHVFIEAILPIGYPVPTDKTIQAEKPTIMNKRVYFEKYLNKYKKPFSKANP